MAIVSSEVLFWWQWFGTLCAADRVRRRLNKTFRGCKLTPARRAQVLNEAHEVLRTLPYQPIKLVVCGRGRFELLVKI